MSKKKEAPAHGFYWSSFFIAVLGIAAIMFICFRFIF